MSVPEGAGQISPSRGRVAELVRSAGLVGLVWLPFGIYLAGYFPGVMTFDSLDQWRQVVDGRWVDNQPVLHTAIVWVGVKTGGPGLVALFQSVFLAAGLVRLARSLVEFGADRRAVAVAVAACVLNPAVGLFSVCLWKDVPFTAAVLFMAAAVVRCAAADSRGAPGGAVHAAILWGFVAAGLRQNGVAVSATTLAAVAVLLPVVRRQAVFGTVGVLLFFGLTRAVAVPVLGLQPMPQIAGLGTVVHEIAAVVRHRPESVDAADWRTLERVAAPAHWYGGYVCESSHPLQTAEFDAVALEESGPDVVRVWSRLVRREPLVLLGHRACVSRIAWDPTHETGTWFFTATRGIELNDLGLESSPLSWALHQRLNEVVSWTEGPGRLNFFWRAPMWVWLAFAMLGVTAWRRRGVGVWVLAAPIVGQQLSILLYNTAQDARYMAASGLVAVLLSALWVPRSRPGATAEAYIPTGRWKWMSSM